MVSSVRTDEVLIVKGPLFFAKRESNGKATLEPSDETIDKVLQRFKTIIIFSATKDSRRVADYVKKRHPPTMVVEMDNDAVMASVSRMVEALMSVGLVVGRPHNLREISWLNIDKFINDKRAVVVGPDGHSILGIEVEQEPDMNEMMRRRQRANEWG